MKTVLSGLIIAALAGTTAHAATTTDRNATLTRAQAQSNAEAAFTRLDSNKDGKIDATDRTARRAAMFDVIDTDKNGQISRTEMEAARTARTTDLGQGVRMHRMDGHGKGGYRMGRRDGGMRGKGAGLATADTNKDNALSKAEFMAAATQRFELADANKDGQVTAAERQAARAARRAAPKAP